MSYAIIKKYEASKKIVTSNDEHHYNYSLFSNFNTLKKDEVPSSSQYIINYVGPVLCEDIQKEQSFFNKCVEDTCSQIVEMYNGELFFDAEKINYDSPSNKLVDHNYIKAYLLML